MSNDALSQVREMIESAETSLRAAKQLLFEITGDAPVSESPRSKLVKKATALEPDATEDNVLEGVFDGQGMIGPDKRAYPVPANYASKSKLVPGDVLKLTIKEDGAFLYKQIKPIERKHIIGILTNDDGQYKVIGQNGKAYKILLASVTYFRGEVGDRVTLIIPAVEDSEWGALENVLPKSGDDMNLQELNMERF
ncbi:MAG: hypothetical protein NTX63_04835 [Candidatus Peregrinibacteria bacterium]|nr:hypothetical protein [Candidatus Peregrinibacteria bacterium]